MSFTDLLFSWLVRSAGLGFVILLVGSGESYCAASPCGGCGLSNWC